jgi:hypothetical protein
MPNDTWSFSASVIFLNLLNVASRKVNVKSNAPRPDGGKSKGMFPPLPTSSFNRRGEAGSPRSPALAKAVVAPSATWRRGAGALVGVFFFRHYSSSSG